MPSLSLEYVPVEVLAAKGGQPYDPTADHVELAFVAPGSRPGPGDWVTGVWQKTGAGLTARYYAAALVGPTAKALAAGTYVVWVRVTDNPEMPVLESPEALVIT